MTTPVLDSVGGRGLGAPEPTNRAFFDATAVRASFVVAMDRRRRIVDLGWSREEAAMTRARLLAFEEDWDAPGMDAYESMLAAQDGRCDICGVEMTRPVIDHDHSTGAVRALLCSPCNTGIGHLGDDIVRLEAAIEYLRKHGSSPT